MPFLSCPHLCFCLITTPAFTPKPLRAQAMNGDLMLGIVGQILIQVGKAIRVLAELLIHDTVVITSSNLPATGQEQGHNIRKLQGRCLS